MNSNWLDEDQLAIYLINVCGHGVRAALLSISIINILRSQALPDIDFENPPASWKALIRPSR
ncbi:MAG: hypothetical protein M2R45_01622 [Verrucomicrobia subdivision 3 bacterium]|nr:hypothetical protein [Limisphaerales bacterium]MCS1412773.1 hypothetical protein [Limisphaerales bacterium]